ncbi:peptide ABC transporter substrate-binding protein [Rossellomorea vietnamensis]|uniref:Peptide ABC transporter substrate-binding protein n=1 Tax=Rossellomorea vietnamensis TaxID=218284 RepID=A0A5D4KGJ1_9BACI|nr:peptide ABC transporter substrate-binding protein [Rossellomorea vietnamensis]TYR75970.1 peptide ABC transporter substrate-binding protein [Rossellomorea vietnamensis]
MKKSLLKGILMLLVTAPFISACSGGEDAAGSGEVSQEITVNASSEPPSLDPALATDTTSGWIIEHTFEGLYTNDENGEVVPALAEDVEISEDKKTYTFTLRDAKWSNGDPITANDFEYSWKRTLNPETGSSFAFYLYYLKGAEEYNKDDGSAEDVGVKALDEKTLQVELKSPTGFFEKLLAFWSYYPVNQSVVEENENWAAEADTLVSNGPYTLTTWQHDSELVAEKNQEYWNKDDISMEKITWEMISDATTYYQMYKSGELDLINTLPTDVIAQEEGNEDFKITPYFGTYMFMFNVEKEPFTNQKVRKAFNMAIDRESITENISQSGETPAHAFVPYGVETPDGDFREQKEKYFEENVEEAKRLIEEAKQEEGWDELPEVELIYNTSENHKKIAEGVQEMLKQNLGIEVTLNNQEWKTYLDTTDQGNFQMARMGWIGIYVDPTPILDYYLGDSPNNRTNWVNEKYDSLISESKGIQDEAERMKVLHEAESVLMEDLPFMPVYFYSQNYLTSTDYEGVVYPVNRYPNLRWAEKVSN